MLKWIGNIKGAAGIVGIPARDLSGDEVKRFGGEKALLATGLYEKADARKAGAIKSNGMYTVGEPGPELIIADGDIHGE